MRIRLTDGVREVEIRCTAPHPTRNHTYPPPSKEGPPPCCTNPPSLPELEGVALRLMQSMAGPEEAQTNPVGFTGQSSLDSNVERSDQGQGGVEE